MKFEVIEFPSTMFVWQRNVSTWGAEASDLGNRHLQKLYDDACDVGFKIRSVPTGKVVTYVMTEVVYMNDLDGEIAYWNYEPTAESIREVPGCKGTKARIFND